MSDLSLNGYNSDTETESGINFFSAESSSEDSFHSLTLPLNSLLDTSFSAFSKNFNVVHINAQSIPSHFPDFLASFDSDNIHAILVSETFLKPCLPSTSYSLPNFHIIRNDRTGKGGGGVAIYLRKHIPFSILNMSSSQYSESSEHILIEVLFGRLKLLLGVFYSPSLHINYFQTFEALLEEYVSTVDHTIIMGDFNTCLLKNDARAKRLTNIIDSCNLHILPTKATHFFPNCTPSQLDLMITSSTDHVSSYGQLSADAFSYHDLIYLSYKIRPPKVKPTIVMQRSFKYFDNISFIRDLNDINWNAIFNASNINNKLEIFNSLLTGLFDKHAPFRPIKLKHLPAPWLTSDIKVLMVKRNAAKFKYKIKPTDENLAKYKFLRNRCSTACRDAQRKFIHAKIENSDFSETWKFLGSLGIGRQRMDTSPSFNLEDFNKHFANIVPIDNGIKQNSLNHLGSFRRSYSPDFHFEPISIADVKKHILAIKSGTAGCDGINRKMLLLLLDNVAAVLCHILNFSLSSNEFPRAWKNAHVIPIPKIKNPTSFSHYRPISILPFLSKVLERIVHHQLQTFLTKNNILNPNQSGFRAGHSTVTALIKVCDDIRFNMDNRLVSIMALLDFSNAFNTVDFDLLLGVLRSINISSEVVNWFDSYLHGRQQRVKIDDRFSFYCPITAGVPQGGVLSPLLFAIYINTVTELLSSSFHLYADDLQVYTAAPFNAIDIAIENINRDLDKINSWSESYGLRVNPKKTQVILLGGSKQLNKIVISELPPIRLGTAVLDISSTVKNLGIYIDSSFSWVPQIAEVSRKVFASIGCLRRWKNFLPIKTKISLCHSLLFPFLDYADSSYPDLSEEQLNKLERLQNLLIRFIFGLRKFDHVSEYRARLKWLPIRLRRNLHLLTLLYSILYNPQTPSYLKQRFSYLGSNVERQHLRACSDNRLSIPVNHTRSYSNSFTCKSVILWNSLPSEVRHSKSLSIFKSRLYNHYLSVCK